MKNNTKVIISSTLAGIFALAVEPALAVPDQPKQWEKCAGIAKTGMNDCGAVDGKHNCAGQAAIDNADNEWVYLPKGTCTKVTGGFVVALKPAKS